MGKIYHKNICGIDVSFFSDESQEYTEEILLRTNERIKSVINSSQIISPPRAAVVTCLELCDELEKEKYQTTELKEKLEEIIKKLDRAVVDRAESETRAAMLKQEVLDLTIKLSNLRG